MALTFKVPQSGAATNYETTRATTAPRTTGSKERAMHEKLHKLITMYYQMHPRSFDEQWPNPEYFETDQRLRSLLVNNTQLQHNCFILLEST